MKIRITLYQRYIAGDILSENAITFDVKYPYLGSVKCCSTAKQKKRKETGRFSDEEFL